MNNASNSNERVGVDVYDRGCDWHFSSNLQGVWLEL